MSRSGKRATRTRAPSEPSLTNSATTDAKRHDAQHISVVFSTYHSLNVVSRA